MFGDKLREIRLAANVSQKQLADALYISQQAIAKWESNRSSPNPEMINKLADYFGVTADYLLDRNTPEAFQNNADLSPSEENIKVALFGGDGEVTDEMWDEVKRFAEFVKSKQKKGEK